MLEPAAFRARYTAAPNCAEEPFELYDESLLRTAGIDVQAIRLLAGAGLPREVGLVGNFVALDADGIETWRAAGLPTRYFPIGSNGGVSFFVIEPESGRVLELSSNWQRAELVNSSVAQFAESLCLLAEYGEADQWAQFVERISEIDAPAANVDCRWRELADDFLSLP
ncbi:MAG: SUKH-4 family immunity protein [Hyphomonadaceae bacterium]